LSQIGYVKRTLLEIFEVGEAVDGEKRKTIFCFPPIQEHPSPNDISRGAIAVVCINQSNMEKYCSVDCMIKQ
jgi:hypothetical protein